MKMKFRMLAAEVIDDCTGHLDIKMNLDDQEIFEDSARFYFTDSLDRTWQVAIQTTEEGYSWTLEEKVGEDWFISCSGDLKNEIYN